MYVKLIKFIDFKGKSVLIYMCQKRRKGRVTYQFILESPRW